MKTKIKLFQGQVFCAAVVGMTSPLSFAATFSDANWISMGGIPGTDGYVYAAAADGAGNLYIAGSFTGVGNVIANHIAKWDGSSWSALGSGVNNSVQALAVSGSNVYAGGSFTTAGGIGATNIAKWDGNSWSALGTGTDQPVQALAASGSAVYAGGQFRTAGGIAATNVAKWDGSSWSALGSGIDGLVYALAVSGSDLYAGGAFATAGGMSANGIAKWNGTDWSALGSGMGDVYPTVYALVASGSDVYVGGYFTTAGGIAAANMAKWNGSGWSALGSGVSSSVYALAVSGSTVHVVNDPPGGMYPSGFVLKWDGNNWSTLGVMNGNFSGGSVRPVYALAVLGNDLYAGGYFTTVSGTSASDIAKWDGSSWSALGSGMNGIFPNDHAIVNAVAVSGTNVYAGGDFGNAGDAGPSHIARWNGNGWSALGAGIPSFFAVMNTLALSGGELYAGGTFTQAGGIAANNVAKWDGSNWSALGSGVNGVVSALVVSVPNVYAGGSFTTAGNVAATNIAKWNGSSWSVLGSGLSAPPDYPYYGGSVHALAVSGSDVYAAGNFTTAGGIVATNIAKWNGSSWSALGSGLGSASYEQVRALAVLGSNLYAGGQFTTAGGIAATNIAKWDGNGWSALGSGISGPYGASVVSALAVSGGNLYVGGSFTIAGGTAANYIAKWDGSSWSALGSGMGGISYYAQVSALAVSGSDLYAGGGFTAAGGKVSANVARAIVNPPVLDIEPDGFGGYFLRFSGVPGSEYRLQRAPALSGPWATSSPQMAPTSGFLEFWDVFAPSGQGFYRSVQP